MFDPSSFANPTPLAHADTSRDVLPRGVINDVPFELLSFANTLDYATLDIRLDLVLNVRKRDLSPTALHAIALETINTRFPPEEWLHIYTDGSLLDFAQGAGIGVFSHLFSFYLHAGPLTTHFDASRVARDKPWSTLCKKSHGIPSSPRAAAVVKFRLLTGHDCLCAHLFRFNLVTSPICVLCDTGQDMTAAHLDECSTLNDLNCIVKRTHVDDFLRGRIIGRLEWGCTQLEVSEEFGIAQSVISRLWQRFQDDGNGSRCYSTGRPRVTTSNEDRYLAVTVKRNGQRTASDLSRQLSSATGRTVSRQTVYRRLGHIGLYARKPVRCVPLTATHCRLRLTWSREHALWTPQQWSCVMFSDESRFSLQSDSRRTLIWRAPGTRYHQENPIERHRYGGAGWLARVWGGIILGSRTDLHVQSVTMTGHIYRDVILEQHVRLFRGAMDAEFLFMDDIARPHRANIVDECLQSEDITRMDWASILT
ncbi:transposable element Tcb1 transposase [Trichonephila clavipes]|nr:transposable element Tcb1 transposase [Trichonephila clavipes]